MKKPTKSEPLYCIVCDQPHKPKEFLNLRIEEDGAVTFLCPNKKRRGIFNPKVVATKIYT
jgi:hypothetical protein